MLDEMLADQKSSGLVWSPSKMIERFGQRINSEESIAYWAAKNQIPIFCPAITDGMFGVRITFSSKAVVAQPVNFA